MKLPTVFATLLLAARLDAAGTYTSVSYPPSDAAGELKFGVTFTVWLPPGVKTVRGVIVHQHGCGSGACKGGTTAARDLHWQALAAKWDCALLGPAYQQEDAQNCRLWCDPRNGSGKAFRTALGELATKTGHPELAAAPWCLWGHSGGGFWASIIAAEEPGRVVAVWCRSGTAFPAWEKGEVPTPTLTPASYGVPVVLNPGAKEKGDKRFNGAWTGAEAMFAAYRAKGAPVAFAADPRTAHECGDSRYLAIPYFDACLAARLPETGAALKPIDPAAGWLAPPAGGKPVSAKGFTGKAEEFGWLPSESVAKAWAEYVATGAVGDTTPPPAPFAVKLAGNVLTWDATADPESGLRGFVVERDGKAVATLPEKPVFRFGRPLFQAMSYHDTPESPVPEMTYTDKTAAPGAKHEYKVYAVNGVGLKSKPGTP